VPTIKKTPAGQGFQKPEKRTTLFCSSFGGFPSLGFCYFAPVIFHVRRHHVRRHRAGNHGRNSGEPVGGALNFS
jgi:hypothetical protein